MSTRSDNVSAASAERWYKAVEDCFFRGALHKAGTVWKSPKLDKLPCHIVEVSEADAEKASERVVCFVEDEKAEAAKALRAESARRMQGLL